MDYILILLDNINLIYNIIYSRHTWIDHCSKGKNKYLECKLIQQQDNKSEKVKKKKCLGAKYSSTLLMFTNIIWLNIIRDHTLGEKKSNLEPYGFIGCSSGGTFKGSATVFPHCKG